MSDYTTEGLAEGETVTVTIRVEGRDDYEGELTIIEIEGAQSARVENGQGDEMALNFWGGSFSDDVASLQRGGETLAKVVSIEGYDD